MFSAVPALNRKKPFFLIAKSTALVTGLTEVFGGVHDVHKIECTILWILIFWKESSKLLSSSKRSTTASRRKTHCPRSIFLIPDTGCDNWLWRLPQILCILSKCRHLTQQHWLFLSICSQEKTKRPMKGHREACFWEQGQHDCTQRAVTSFFLSNPRCLWRGWTRLMPCYSICKGQLM